MIRYRFEVLYQTKQMKQASDFLISCDLGMDGIFIKDVMYFNYTKEEQPISYFKELITKAMEECDCYPFRIEGGKIE